MKASLMTIGPARQLTPTDTSAVVYSNRPGNNKWTVAIAKRCRKSFPSKNPTEANNTYPLSAANRYEQLTYKTC